MDGLKTNTDCLAAAPGRHEVITGCNEKYTEGDISLIQLNPP